MNEKRCISGGIVGCIAVMMVMVVVLNGRTEQQTSGYESHVEPTLPATESLQAILSKADTIESMYYEIAASLTMSEYGTQTVTMYIWQEKPYLKQQIISSTGGYTHTITILLRPEKGSMCMIRHKVSMC
jgi:hypothetical protein